MYNVGNGTPTQLRDAVDYVVSQIASTSEITSRGTRVPELKHMNVDRLFALGYQPQWTLEQTLDDLIQRG